ncbi:MAG TPA: FUSC family protein [Mycobacteriales bacterium]|nr:FUSC family protein [Mycobacteriales bacterium]
MFAALRKQARERLAAASVAMTAALLSFGTALLLEHEYHLTTSTVVLAVALALTLGRADQRGHESRLARLLAPLALPFLAVASAEVGRLMFTHPNVGDGSFVVGMTVPIWLRRFGPHVRRAGTLLMAALTGVLITPAPAVALGSNPPSRWWAAVVALVALGWLRIVQAVAERFELVSRPTPGRGHPSAAVRPKAGAWHRRLPASSKMALQMGVALTAAFLCGRAAFGMEHWTWVVLSAYIVGSGNRGRADVTHKAALRVGGAAIGTLLATALSHAFPPGEDWSIVALFAVLAVALWLRPLSYAYWAAGMTSALALLYDFYGETGDHLLATRLEGILLGASLAVISAWVVLPIRNVDAVRRQLSIAFGAVATVLSSPEAEPMFPAADFARFRAAAAAAELAATSLHWLRRLPTRLRTAYSYAVASRALSSCAAELDAGHGHRLVLPTDVRQALSADVAAARRALAATANDEERARLGETTQRIATALVTGYQ